MHRRDAILQRNRIRWHFVRLLLHDLPLGLLQFRRHFWSAPDSDGPYFCSCEDAVERYYTDVQAIIIHFGCKKGVHELI